MFGYLSEAICRVGGFEDYETLVHHSILRLQFQVKPQRISSSVFSWVHDKKEHRCPAKTKMVCFCWDVYDVFPFPPQRGWRCFTLCCAHLHQSDQADSQQSWTGGQTRASAGRLLWSKDPHRPTMALRHQRPGQVSSWKEGSHSVICFVETTSASFLNFHLCFTCVLCVGSLTFGFC